MIRADWLVARVPVWEMTLIVLVVGAVWAWGLSWIQWTMPVPPRFYTTDVAAARAMLKLADVKPGELVADLGCGDGRIVVVAARDFGARGLCVERDGDVMMDARANARIAGVSDRIEFVVGDVRDADLRGVDVVTLFLSPDLNLALRDKLRGVGWDMRVVSQLHDMGDWVPDVTEVYDPGGQARPLFLWRVIGKAVTGTMGIRGRSVVKTLGSGPA